MVIPVVTCVSPGLSKKLDDKNDDTLILAAAKKGGKVIAEAKLKE